MSSTHTENYPHFPGGKLRLREIESLKVTLFSVVLINSKCFQMPTRANTSSTLCALTRVVPGQPTSSSRCPHLTNKEPKRPEVK